MRARFKEVATVFGIWLVCMAGCFLIGMRMFWCVFASQEKAREIAAALSRTGNAAANGNPRETISSRAHRARSEERLWGCRLCRLLDWLDPNHCRDAAANDSTNLPESQP